MRLGDLVSALDGEGELPGPWRQREVTGLVQDSRKASPGSVFVAVRGFHSDGHQFIPQAVRQGAAAVVAEESARVEALPDTPVIRVPDSRRALARLAARFYDYPSRRLALAGITGTNGKTTTSYLVRSIIEAAGHTAGLIGTIDYRIGDTVYPAPNTTPESLDLQKLLAEMAGRGATYCVMEVSSHALALGRTDGCEFRAAAFTNLTQDHLDFHETMEAYFQAKLLLFSGLAPGAVAVVNRDDARAADIISSTRAQVVTFGFSQQADVRPEGPMRHGLGGLTFTASTPAGAVTIASPLVGRYNSSNILTAIGMGIALGFSREAISAGISSMQAVPGRMEKVDAGQPFGVFVDYAHTEDALIRLLEAVREVAAKRVITVFGCGGDRDRTKRPKMGAAAVRGSDIVIVTSDNPRTEDAMAIIREIENGMAAGGIRLDTTRALAAARSGVPYLVIPDRAEAIDTAVSLAAPGDIVVLAGKGHEDYQIVGATKHHFDDREQARMAIAKRSAKAGAQGAATA
jgi:UDP-N-acetylmuramoyl-L-alanyl-D-glutamate--2,6-diaminopimelate ligase